MLTSNDILKELIRINCELGKSKDKIAYDVVNDFSGLLVSRTMTRDEIWQKVIMLM